MDLQLRIEEVIRSNGEAAMTNLDRRMISKLNELTSNKIEKDLLSEGLLKPTGKNCISLMTTSGAKGGNVSDSAFILGFSFSIFTSVYIIHGDLTFIF